MKRVVIIGGSGSGKSTLARDIGKAENLPVIHLDKYFFDPGWVERDRHDFDRDVDAEIEKPTWVMDGNFTSSLPRRLARADTFIFLDIPARVRLWGVIKRMFKNYGKVRPDMALDCPEGFDWDFLQWVIGYAKRGDRANALNLLKNAPNQIAKYHLKSRTQIRCFVRDIKERIDN